MSGKLNMGAYYYSFEETGAIEIDKILSAVASAGHAAHNTEDWGESIIDGIQKAANDAASVEKMSWAEERPTEEGWYWVKTFTGNVTMGFFCGDRKKTYMPSFSGWELLDATRMEWYGPLTPPS